MSVILSFDDRTPQIDGTAWVAPNATIIGDVVLHPESSVFYGAVLRADSDTIVLGAGSNLQDNVVVHVDEGVPVTIGAGATEDSQQRVLILNGQFARSLVCASA